MEQESDPRLVELAQAGDQQAFAELYNRYFDPVYDFVARMVRNRDEAADIAQDTFLKAMNSLGGLQKGASFKGWIFTIARNTALNRLERSRRTRPLAFEDDDGEEVSFEVVDTDRFADPAEAAEANATAALVWQAAAGLDPKQLSLLDLHLRQGLDSGEIADALGVTKNNGYVMLNRLKKAVEEAIGAFIMFKDGRRYCDDLNAAIGNVDIAGMSPEVRKLVDRHVAQCEVCSERKKKLVAPLAVFSAFAMVGPPTGAKAQILEGLIRQWPPAATGGGTGGTGGAGGGGSAGGAPAGAAGRRGGYFLKTFAGLGLAAAFLLALLLLPGSPIALTRANREKLVEAVTNDEGSPSPSASPSAGAPSPSPSLSGVVPSATPTGSGGSPSPSPSPSVVAGVPSASPSSTPSSPPTGAASPSPSPIPTTAVPTKTPPPTSTPTATPTTACTPSLSTNLSDVNLSSGSNSFELLNGACGTVTFSIFPSGQAPWLHVSPTSGQLAPLRTTTIGLSADLAALSEGLHSAPILISWTGGGGVVVTATVNKAGNPPLIVRPACTTVPSTNLSGYTISAQVTDDFAVASVTVDYTRPDDSTGEAAMMPSGSLYAAPILGAVQSFTITATDQAGHVSTASGTCR